jgi:hypothetical protein
MASPGNPETRDPTGAEPHLLLWVDGGLSMPFVRFLHALEIISETLRFLQWSINAKDG